MLIVLKAILLFFSIIVVLPIVFFLLIGTFGNYFALTIDRRCWLAKTNVRWIKNIVNKFLLKM